MSIFDAFDKNLPGDHHQRRVQLDKDEYELFPAEEEIFEKTSRNFNPLYVCLCLIFVGLSAQLLNLQITHGSFNRFLAEGNRIRTREVAAPRGIIYDQKMKALVSNDASFVLQVYPLDIPRTKADRQKYFDDLSLITQIPTSELSQKIDEKKFSSAPVILKENMDRDSALLLETKINNFPGVVMAKVPVRKYESIAGLSPVLGYIGKVSDAEIKSNTDENLRLNQNIGKDGLEKVYQSYLKGRDGVNEIEVDSRGKAQRMLTTLPPQTGNNLVLSLNAGLEEVIADSLSKNIDAAGSSAGAAIAVNPQNGEILAYVSLPTYDNNIFSQGASSEEYQKILLDKNKPLFNRVIAGAYPSGSTIKPLVAAAGLQENVITERTTIDDDGAIKVGSWTYPDWKAHGLVDVRKAIAESCNVFFYAVGGGWDKIRGLGPAKLQYYYEKFGLGEKTGIDLPGEVKGLVPTPKWKEKNQNEMWYLGDTYHMAIGQGDVLTTPLQMAMATAAIANGGTLVKPHLVTKITDNSGNSVKDFSKEIIRSGFVDAENIKIVQEGMRQGVISGSSKLLNDLPVEAASKTGTAQYANNTKTHAWMVSYAPYDNPTIAIAVIVEGGGEGYAAAGPVVKDAFYWYFTQN